MLTRTAGVELGPHGIRVINVAPGAVATPINESTLTDPEKLNRLTAAIPLARLAGKYENRSQWERIDSLRDKIIVY